MSAAARLARAGALGLCCALTGCSAALDVERAREIFSGPERPEMPVLVEGGALPAPEGVRAVSGLLRAVPLVWDPLLAPGTSGYVIERALASTGPFERIAVVTEPFEASYVDEGVDLVRKAPQAAGSSTGLGDGATYHYRLRAYDAQQRISASASAVVAATTAPPPGPPAGLRAVSQLPRKVALAWRPSEDPLVAKYKVYRSPSSTGSFHPVAELPGRYHSTYVDRDLGDLRVFYYRVASVNALGGEGQPTEPVRGVTKADPLPPVALRVSEQGLGRNVLVWDANVERDVARYRVLRRRAGQSQDELVAEVASSVIGVEDTGVGPDEVVTYVLEAVDADGLASAPSPPLRVTSAGYEAKASVEAGAVVLTFRPRPDEGFPAVRIEREGFVGRDEVGRETGGRFVDRDVKSGSRYRYFLIYERPGAGEAPPSPPVDVQVP